MLCNMKAMSLSSCIRIAPILFPLASVSIVTGNEKLGSYKMVLLTINF